MLVPLVDATLVARWPCGVMACCGVFEGVTVPGGELPLFESDLDFVVLAAFSVLLMIPGDWVLAVIFVSVALLTREAIVDLFAIEMPSFKCAL